MCKDWQAFLQQLVHNFVKGYYYYSYQILPEKRRHQWKSIDERIINRFGTGNERGKRYYDKKAGKPNYLYLRWESILIIMKTNGVETLEDRLKQPFSDIRTHPLEICPVSGRQKAGEDSELVLKVGLKADGGKTVRLTKTCYKNLKVKMLEMIERRQSEKAVYAFNALNNIPAYAGIIEHKRLILTDLLQAAKKHGVRLKRSDFKLTTRLYIRKVFVEN